MTARIWAGSGRILIHVHDTRRRAEVVLVALPADHGSDPLLQPVGDQAAAQRPGERDTGPRVDQGSVSQGERLGRQVGARHVQQLGSHQQVQQLQAVVDRPGLQVGDGRQERGQPPLGAVPAQCLGARRRAATPAPR